METESRKYFQIMTNRPKDPGLQVTNYIKNYLEDRGAVCTIYADNETADQIHVSEAGHTEKASCMIVLGGDGTLLKAAREIADSGVPLLGVNLGTVGFLAEVELAGLDAALDRLLAGEYTVEERMMLSGCVLRRSSDTGELQDGDGAGDPEWPDAGPVNALNDVALTRKGPMQVVRFQIWVNGQMLSSYCADGIVIATPTGSTGYNMSAGGPIVKPGAELILLTPICPHTLNTRSIILGADDEIEIEIGQRSSGHEQEVEANFDGSVQFTLKTGDRIRVRRSEMTTSIMKLSADSFLERLHRKMSE